ncbi:hypothetical protein EUTSA_v10002171mg [Eutrema salsugineum]|uniref:C2H2-type domain-containing protein n=1 Tax=Eutrema salsugineum TaxID=72664 RepID=V4NTM6_EUTSA|nr:uncharacterized protein LOC18025502 [Eutrema salsugineum]ESQ50056.1 hypothetical protein EUTSA_v10002171mg [Eutrema salsugineum]
MKRTRDDPSHFLHQSSLYDEDDDDSYSSESGEFQALSPPPQRKHFCVICDKQFSSGKAYGGHVRIHSSDYNNKGKTKKMKMKKKRKIGMVKKEKEKEKELDLVRADVEGKIRCCLCGKEFQTMHSLFGHMRRHPDRSWKGIRPPPPPENFKLSFLDDGDDDDQDDDGMSRSMSMSDVTEDVQNAACCLMMLHCAAMRILDMETPNSEVRSSSRYNGEEHGKRDGEIDDKGLVVDMKIKMENNPKDDEAKGSLGFDLNQPYHEDNPYSYWN